LFFNPNGLEDPLSCKKIKCVIIKTDKIKGNKKCKEKNRFNVGFSTENPPQTQVTRVAPK